MSSQGEELGGLNPAIKRHLELRIKTFQMRVKDLDKS